MQSFVPKARRPRFDFTLRILDLNNVPLVSGTCFIKWHLPSSTSAEHRGRTPKCTIKEHKVDFDYEKTLQVRLVVGKDQMLQESYINFEVLQEYSSGGKGERLVLGNIKLNLAEYVEASEQSHGNGKDEEGVTRRYLMQDSKINSTLKIGMIMNHVEGDKNYYAPPLRTAPVFGGIAGIMSTTEVPATSADAADKDPSSAIPSLSSKSRDAGEMQDMYRRTLAASWVAQPGELRADDCIEDIFCGGDGWGSHLHAPNNHVKISSSSAGEDVDGHDQLGTDSRSRAGSSSLTPGDANLQRAPSQRSQRSKSPGRFFGGGKSSHKHNKSATSFTSTRTATSTNSPSAKKAGANWNAPSTGAPGHRGVFGGRTSLHQQVRRLEMESIKRASRGSKHEEKNTNEVDEFDNDFRTDLRAWQVGSQQQAEGQPVGA